MTSKSFINEAGKRVTYVQSESDPFRFKVYIDDEPIDWLSYFNNLWKERENEHIRK